MIYNHWKCGVSKDLMPTCIQQGFKFIKSDSKIFCIKKYYFSNKGNSFELIIYQMNLGKMSHNFHKKIWGSTTVLKIDNTEYFLSTKWAY